MLIVLQGIDAAGKDGTIHKVMEAFNPQGCPVSASRCPSTEELAHDFLWRIHKRVPGKGEIGIFNRSHYEDVLVVRVHDLVPKTVWKRSLRPDHRVRGAPGRQRHDDRQVLPVHRPDEQRERFQARYDDPTKRWKFSLGDLEERKLWDDYMAAFDDALSKTSTDVRRGTSSRPTEVVPQPGRRVDPGRHDRRSSIRLPGTPRTCRRTWSSSSGEAAQAAGEFDEPSRDTVAEAVHLVILEPAERALPGQRRPMQPSTRAIARGALESARGATSSHASR